MKQLIGIRLVQFFLYEARNITIGRTSGIFGANGSGKSSLLDAVQIVMLGASAHRGHGVVFNAQADEKKASTRSIRAYCLGQYDVTEGSRVRDDATTYITLVWQDTKTRELLSTGVCVSASSQRENHEVLGRYIFRSDLTLGDHLQLVDGEERPRDWASFREQLRQRSGPNEDPLFHEADRFVRALLLALRGDNAVAQLDAFRQAFRFGLKMGFDKSIDEIVRHQVIEAKPTNVKRFRDNFDLWKQVQATVAETSDKVKAATAINEHFEAALKFQRRAVTWPALGKAIALEAANAATNAAEEAEAKALKDKEKADLAEEEAGRAAVEAERIGREAASKRDTHAAHTEQQLAQQQKSTADTRHAELAAELRATLRLTAARIDSTLAGAFSFKADDVARQASKSISSMLAESDLPSRGVLEATARGGLKAAKQLADELFGIRRDLEIDLARANDEVKAAIDDLERIAQGKVPLDGPARALKSRFSNAGIDATPVCDLVDIDDKAWQPVIEAYLGTATLQALLLTSGAPDDEARAYQIYRQSDIYGAKYASGRRHEQRRSPPAGSVAELIRSKSSQAAANYLRSKFGECMRAGGERDAFAHPSTLTADGMLFRDGELDRLRPVSPALFRIGPVTAGARSALQATLEQAQAKARSILTNSEKAKELYDGLGLIAGDIDGRLAFVMGKFDDAAAQLAAATEAQRCLEQIATGDYQVVKRAAETAAKEAQELRSKATAAASAAGAAQKTYEQQQQAAQAARVLQGEAAKAADAARNVADFDADYYSEQWDRLVLEGQGLDAAPGSFSALEDRCRDRASRASSDSNGEVNDAQEGLTKYLIEFPREHLPETARGHWTAKASWIAERKHFLASTELPQRQKEADDALATARNIFRSDVAVHINERLEWLEATFDRMNEALRTAPAFTNGERYLFKKPLRPAHVALHKFIVDVAQFGPSEDLLGGAGEVPPEFDALMRDQTDPDAKTARSPLDDYREFFEFDVQILREDPVTGVRKQVGMLSQRVGSGSGGEHRAPLYVMAGAALASAYHVKPGDDSGLRLIVLDEAFLKMDPHNIAATMRYFEELGLQVLMASTGDALGTLTAFLDRYYDIMRDPYQNIIVLEGHDIDQKTRDMFRADMIEFHPELIDEEVQRLQTDIKLGARVGATVS